ncbi:APC family permease [Acidocella facilis]|uniref:APC family permease n=1 Tax=Acidocella facilis TaxID=525 RepID=UPI00047EA2E6|nr:APC family permease [Acidocella facilis]
MSEIIEQVEPAAPSILIATSDAGLKRGAIGLAEAFASTLANIAPAEAIFSLIGLIAAFMGSFTPWTFLITGFAIAATGWNLSEFAVRVPSAGSFIGFIYHGGNAIRPGYGRFTSAMTFYLGILGGPITLASVSVFLGSWVQTALGLPNIWWLIIALAGIVLSVPVLLRGIAASTHVAFVLFLVEAVGLVLFSVVVLAQSGPALAAPLHPAGGMPGGFAGLNGIVFTAALFSYVGWENSGSLGEELRHPRRNVPIAVIGSIAMIGVLYILVTWAAVSGYAAWHGAGPGMTRLADPTNAAPFIELTDHYMPWFHWVMVFIGLTSAIGSYIAAVTAVSRWTYAAARGGLLPAPFARVSAISRVPVMSVLIWNLLIGFFVIAAYFLFNGDAVTGTGYLAGIGAAPITVGYFLMALLCPVFIWRTDRARFGLFRHVLPALIGVVTIGNGLYQAVSPYQPPPANRFWIYIGGIFVLALAATIYKLATRGAAIDRLGYVVPEDEA